MLTRNVLDPVKFEIKLAKLKPTLILSELESGVWVNGGWYFIESEVADGTPTNCDFFPLLGRNSNR